MSGSTSQMHSELQSLRLLHHEENFLKHGVESLDDLILLSREDLSELGVVKVGERNRLWAWIQDRQAKCLQTAPPSFEDSAVVLGKKCDKSSRDEIAGSVRNLVTQAKSLLGSTTSPVTINVSMKLDGQSKRTPKRKTAPQFTPQKHLQSSRSISKQKSASSLIFHDKDGKSPAFSPRLFRKKQSKDSRNTESRELLPSPSQQESNSPLIFHKKDGKESSLPRSLSLRSQMSQECSTSKPTSTANKARSRELLSSSSQRERNSPLIFHKKDGKASSLTRSLSPRSQTSQESSTSKSSHKVERSSLLLSSSGSQTTNEVRTESNTFRKVQRSNPTREQSMRKQNSAPLLISNKQYEKDTSFPRTRSPRSLKSREHNQTKSNQRARASISSHSQSTLKHTSVPLLIHQRNERKGCSCSSQLTPSSGSKTASSDLMKENKTMHRAQYSNPIEQQSIHKQRCAPLSVSRKKDEEESSSPSKHSNYARQSCVLTQHNNDLEHSCLPLLIHQENQRGNHLSPDTHSQNYQRTVVDGTMENLQRRSTCSSQSKRRSKFEHQTETTLVTLMCDRKDPSSLSKDSTCSQLSEDEITEDELARAEQYMVESNFMHMPDITDCKDRYCCAIFNFLMLDKDLVKLFAEKFCSIWLKEANKDDLTRTDLDADAVVDVAIRTFTKIAHRYSHHNALELCNLPNDQAASRVREFRKAALVWVCKSSVDDVLRSKENAASNSKNRNSQSRTIASLDVVQADKSKNIFTEEKKEVDTSEQSHDSSSRHVAEKENVDDSVTAEEKEISPREVNRLEWNDMAFSQDDAAEGHAEQLVAAKMRDTSPKAADRSMQGSMYSPKGDGADGQVGKIKEMGGSEQSHMMSPTGYEKGDASTNEESEGGSGGRRTSSSKHAPLERYADLSATAKKKEISPCKAYQSMKGFWQSVLEKEPYGIFPEAQPFYKSDDPLVHPDLLDCSMQYGISNINKRRYVSTLARCA